MWNASTSRREFLKISAAALAGMLWAPRRSKHSPSDYPSAKQLGRVLLPKAEIKARPSADSQTLSSLGQDEIVVWLRDVVAAHPARTNNVWTETPEGYIHTSALQPVADRSNEPLMQLPDTSLGPGMWAEVTVPWVEFELENPPPRSPWLRNTENPRLYYSQILWVDEVREAEGAAW